MIPLVPVKVNSKAANRPPNGDKEVRKEVKKVRRKASGPLKLIMRERWNKRNEEQQKHNEKCVPFNYSIKFLNE